MPSTADYLVVGGSAAAVTFGLTPAVGWFARRVGWVVQPDERRVHTVPTPDVGGIAMFAGFVVALGVSRMMNGFDAMFAASSEPEGVLIAAAVIFLVGLIDDVRDISPPAKVFGTIVAGMVLFYYGVTMIYFRVPLYDVFLIANEWVPLLTVVWLLGMSQAINFIDGLDGLAAGIVAIAAGSFFVYSRYLEENGLLQSANIGPLVCIIAVGMCLGFLPHNFNPAKIFMGDGGALLLGLLMATSTSVVGGRAPDTQLFFGQSYFFFAPLFIPLFILGVPILDLLFAVIRRATKRQGLATADKGHLHHRLMNLGHGQRRSVLILWSWTALLSGFVLYPVFNRSAVSFGSFGVLAIVLGLLTVLHPVLRKNRMLSDENSEPNFELNEPTR